MSIQSLSQGCERERLRLFDCPVAAIVSDLCCTHEHRYLELAVEVHIFFAEEAWTAIVRHLCSAAQVVTSACALFFLQTGLRGIAHLQNLRSLVLELSPPGSTLGNRVTRQYHQHSPLVLPFTLLSEVQSDISAAAGSLGVPMVGTNPILAFAPPSEWGLFDRVSSDSIVSKL